MPPKLGKGRKKPGRPSTWQGIWQRIPPSSHGVWAVVRLGILTTALYLNASHFDLTEGRTLIAMTLLELIGVRRRS